MPSNARRGAYYKARTKRWLIAQGWEVADMEVLKSVYPPGREPFFVKRDQWGADLIACRAASDELALIQTKGGEAARGGTFPAARRKFAKFTFPSFVQRWVVAWAPRAREPRIVLY